MSLEYIWKDMHTVLCILGVLLAAAIFIMYLIEPFSILADVFCVAIVLMAVGYVLVMKSHRKVIDEYNVAVDMESREGLIFLLDDAYEFSVNDAEIIDLRGDERACRAWIPICCISSSIRPICTDGTTI